MPVLLASKIARISRNRTYRLIKDGTYPIRLLPGHGRNYLVSRADLLDYLHAPAGSE